MTLSISFDDIKKKIAAERDPSKLPAELGMMYGGADEAAKQSKFGPDIWGQIWPYRSPVKPGPKGERVKSWDWKLDEGEEGYCVMAQVPTPIPVHRIFFGWYDGKKGAGWMRKDWMRCLHRRFEYDAAKKVGMIVEMNYKCPFCAVLGPERWNTIQVGGVIDLRKGVEPLIDAYGQAIANPPRALIISNDAGQKAIMSGLAERFRHGRPIIGTIFQVSRGKGQNTASIGTNWIPILDQDVPETEIAKVYHPIDMKYAFPAMTPEASNQFKPEEIPEMVKHILERHVIMSIRHGSKMGKSFRGFDEAGAIAYGLDLKALATVANATTEEGEGGEEKPAAAAPRGVQIAFTPPVTVSDAAQIPASTGAASGNIWDLNNLGAPKPGDAAPAPASAAAPVTPGTPPWDGASQEQEIEPDDIIKMNETELLEVIKEWNITAPRKKDKANLIMRILTHKEGFGMDENAAATKAGLMVAPAEAPVAPPTAPAKEVTLDRAVLMDRNATSIEKLMELAKSIGITNIPKDDKGRVVRSALVAAIFAPVTTQGPEEAPEAPVATPEPATPAAPTPGAARKNVWDD